MKEVHTVDLLVPRPSVEEEKALSSSTELEGADAGTAEAKLLTRGLSEKDLQKEAVEKEHNRSEKFKDHFELLAICTLWIISTLLLLIGGTWLWHLLTPNSWHYLDADQVARLQNLVTGGVVVGVMSTHIKKRIG